MVAALGTLQCELQKMSVDCCGSGECGWNSIGAAVDGYHYIQHRRQLDPCGLGRWVRNGAAQALVGTMHVQGLVAEAVTGPAARLNVEGAWLDDTGLASASQFLNRPIVVFQSDGYRALFTVLSLVRVCSTDLLGLPIFHCRASVEVANGCVGVACISSQFIMWKLTRTH